MKTDIDKTLDILRTYKIKGVHSFILMKLVGSTRVAARIEDLKKRGYNIRSVPEKMDNALGCRYFLEEVRAVKPQIIFNPDGTFGYV